jgi:hypothetical protein
VRVDVPLSYPASPDAVVAMLVDRGYQERKCAALEARQVRIAIQPNDGMPIVIADRVMSAQGAPDVIQAMVPTGIRVVETVSWAPAAVDGSRSAAVRIEFPHHPLTMRGTLSLVGADDGTRGALTAQLRAAVPFVAGRIERMAARLVIRAITVEQAVGADWLVAGPGRR